MMSIDEYQMLIIETRSEPVASCSTSEKANSLVSEEIKEILNEILKETAELETSEEDST